MLLKKLQSNDFLQTSGLIVTVLGTLLALLGIDPLVIFLVLVVILILLGAYHVFEKKQDNLVKFVNCIAFLLMFTNKKQHIEPATWLIVSWMEWSASFMLHVTSIAQISVLKI